MTNEIFEFQRKVLAALGLENVRVKSLRVNMPDAGLAPTIEITAYLRNEQNIRALGEAIQEFSYRPTTRTGGGPCDPQRAAAEAGRTAAQRPVESGHETPVESGKEQGT